MSDIPSYANFYSRQEVALYLCITRMTLHRWEKLVPLASPKGSHIRKIRRDEIDAWHVKVIKHPRYVRRHGNPRPDVTSPRGDVTSTRTSRYKGF